MVRSHRKTTDERAYAAAEDAFTSEGGSLPPSPSQASPDERDMAALRIDRVGLRYRYNGYVYDRLADALAYARLMRSRPAQLDAGGAFMQRDTFMPPTDAQRAQMSELAIRCEDGAYRFEDFRYDRLADAVRYAQQARGRSIR